MAEEQKIPYPRSIFFIFGNEFCERYNYYGMRSVLALYVSSKLHYSETDSTILFHTFIMLSYLSPLIGGILADSAFGKFTVILNFSIVYLIGSVVLSIGAIEPLHLPMNEVTLIALFLIALGSGGIKPCVSAFGGDQFQLPEQMLAFVRFFSVFYFFINIGSFLSTLITPILRENVHCFGTDSCFPLAFGVPALLMFISILFFVFGRMFYILRPSHGNMLIKVSSCVGNAIATKCREKKTNPKPKLLDYAEAKHGKDLIADIRSLTNLIVLYLPLPIFWALYDQQGSRWTFQALRMNGDVGGGITILPDQVQTLNPVLILLFIPLFEYIVYPIISIVGINTSLRRFGCGGMLASVAFILSAIVEFQINAAAPVQPTENFASLRLLNGMPCDYSINSNLHELDNRQIFAYDTLFINEIEVGDKTGLYTFDITTDDDDECKNFFTNLRLESKEEATFILKKTDEQMQFEKMMLPLPARNGKMPFRMLSPDKNKTLEFIGRNWNHYLKAQNATDFELFSDRYTILMDDKNVGEVNIGSGGVYAGLTINDSNTIVTYTVVKPHAVNILWQIPQYVAISAGEIMLSITGLEFSYSQAPPSMKSVIQAAWLMTDGIGNIFVILIAGARFFNNQAYEFLLFAALMFVDMLIFIALAVCFKPRKTDSFAPP